jgi:hypothetical protein
MPYLIKRPPFVEGVFVSRISLCSTGLIIAAKEQPLAAPWRTISGKEEEQGNEANPA